jgi:uncharacterized protein YjiS (DUF1127 family)
MFEKWKARRARRLARFELSHLDAHLLRDMGLNPDDFRDAAEARQTSLLFFPFRHPRDH